MRMKVKNWSHNLIDNKFSFSRGIAVAGDFVEQQLFNERPSFENINFFGKNEKIVNRTDLYTFIKGKFKITYSWTDDENITDEDVDEYITLIKEEEEVADAVIEKGSDFVSITYEEKFKFNSWRDPALKYELATDNKKTEMLQDGTECVCIISTDPSWKTKNVSIKSQTSLQTNKEGDDCYLYVGGDTTIDLGDTQKNINKDQVIKLSSSVCILQNNTDDDFMVIMIYK